MTTPEKIYYTPYGDIREDEPMTDNDLVYVRPDAFIEKACGWLKKHGGSYWMDDYDLPTDDLVNDFRNYMKGE